MSPINDLTQDLKEMVRLASQEEGLDALLHFGLAWVKRVAPYDLTTVFFLEDDLLVVKAAQGKLASKKVMNHVLPLRKFPSIRRALDTRQARAYTEDDHAHGDGDPFDGVLDFPPGHSCMVVPLVVGNRPLGVMTLDRGYCEPYDQKTVGLLEIYGQILALAIGQAEQNDRLRRLYREGHERERLLASELEGEQILDPEKTLSPAMRETVFKAYQVAQTHTPVLILGETGTGKERMASAIHRWSPRVESPFLKINCAAIPENLLESELFGHVKGAFTGATKNRPGRFQMANGGTLLLDEIGEMPMPLQSKLLRVLQEGTFEPVGSDRTVKVDVRILTATHVDLQKAIEERHFREDLYYRLSVFPLTIPPLRERFADLPRLCESLLESLSKRTGRFGLSLSPEALWKLKQYHWPGNIRELANVLERAAILSGGAQSLDDDNIDLPNRERQEPRAPETETDDEPVLTLEELQRRHIIKTLRLVNGKIYGKGGAAELLAIKPSTLQSRMKKLGVQREVSHSTKKNKT